MDRGDMERIRVDDTDSWTSPADSKRAISNAVSAENVAVNHYRLAPGDAFGFGYHRHAN